jgi:outer membrane immunogenic protein
MKKILLATVAIIGLSTVAQAADLPRRMAPTAPQPIFSPVYNWSGFYAGVQVGYAWGDDKTVEFGTLTGVPTGLSLGYSPDGIVGGVHAGANYQMGMFVLGVEGDIEASGISGGTRNLLLRGNDFDVAWQGSIRARAGVAFDRVLVYATGGVAYADMEHTYVNGLIAEKASGGEWGYTVGAGVEYAFTQNLTARVEYRYTAFDKVTNASVVSFPGFSYTQEPEFQTVRGGLSYKF